MSYSPSGRKELDMTEQLHFHFTFSGSRSKESWNAGVQSRVQSLGQEDLLEKEMATHSSILAWKIPWMEEPGRLQSMGSQRVRHN